MTPTTPVTTAQSFTATPASHANRKYWDSDAADYHETHPEYLSSFYWCPEMLHESDAQLLGDISSQRVLEIGCGSAPCANWLRTTYPDATVIGCDLSLSMLRHSTGSTPLVQADALALPFAPASFDTIFSAFGAIPFIEDLTSLFQNCAELLQPNGRFIYATNHPMRWVFLDDPGQLGLFAANSYFESSYTEFDETTGELQYAEYQHTMSDHINALHAAGFHLERMIEPIWPPELTQTWGQWSPLRGKIFPGTAIFIAQKQAHR
ncbi:class I SAM-dependent methyltransferase [Corynebacterium sp. HS2168-gen11]|uniref:class I SAM-dependent methyltransferase n=1 Tax=Corynebacterium sp. HS2168-gen11 TaxID=2974027 RepID=UPI00216B0757|nr:class I SAM-dependent methyltransferase [Corynebacterium sp. HS2168-gen11]MCS4534787.1 class I SAM-dependent methyltransferase [Corynebacterium sp. HS2168-gen11]